jgi:hypothetical protein
MKNIKTSIGYLTWCIRSCAIAVTSNDIHMSYRGKRL